VYVDMKLKINYMEKEKEFSTKLLIFTDVLFVKTKSCQTARRFKMIDLGTTNGWQEKPEIVKNCKEKEHELDQEPTRFNCVKKYTCKICGYYYLVDSGD